MSNCIYYRDRPGLTFVQSEHIIPAGIGGRHTLPKGYVSDQFNHDISKLELGFMRESVIAIGRQMVGPGKRGSVKPADVTRSKVMLVSQPGPPESFFLGYLALGTAVALPQVRIDQSTGNKEWTLPATVPAAEADGWLLNLLAGASGLKPSYISSDRLGIQEAIIGFDDRLYIARHPGSSFGLSAQLIEDLRAAVGQSSAPYAAKNQPISFSQAAVVADDFYRVTAKIALNTLALLKGKAFVLDAAFDTLRRYITTGGQNPGVVLIPKAQRYPQFPLHAHHLIFGVSAGKLACNVCFYNQFTVNVILSNQFTAVFDPAVYLCDWRQKTEGWPVRH
ncbi:hypothetical protein [Mucilaginibacter sp.]|uniref:hypothetical protein n=1 Tax=Mucilaginibacter sp. TaxID=1882438 RepID=UPI003D14AF49